MVVQHLECLSALTWKEVSAGGGVLVMRSTGQKAHSPVGGAGHSDLHSSLRKHSDSSRDFECWLKAWSDKGVPKVTKRTFDLLSC